MVNIICWRANFWSYLKFPVNSIKTRSNKNLEATAEAISVHISNESFSVRQPDTNLCNRLVLNMTNQCNLACKYCYAEGGDYGQENSCLKMTVEVMKKTVDRIYSMYSKGIHQIQFLAVNRY